MARRWFLPPDAEAFPCAIQIFQIAAEVVGHHFSRFLRFTL